MNFVFNPLLYCTGRNDLVDELYLIDDDELVILDANTLAKKAGYIADKWIRSVATNDNGLLVLRVRDNTAPIQILARDGLNVLNNLSSSNTSYSSGGVIFSSKEENEFVEVGEDYFTYFKVNNVGEVLEQEEMTTPFSDSDNTYYSMITSPLGNYFVTKTHGQLFDSSLNGVSEFFDFLWRLVFILFF